MHTFVYVWWFVFFLTPAPQAENFNCIECCHYQCDLSVSSSVVVGELISRASYAFTALVNADTLRTKFNFHFFCIFFFVFFISFVCYACTMKQFVLLRRHIIYTLFNRIGKNRFCFTLNSMKC